MMIPLQAVIKIICLLHQKAVIIMMALEVVMNLIIMM